MFSLRTVMLAASLAIAAAVVLVAPEFGEGGLLAESAQSGVEPDSVPATLAGQERVHSAPATATWVGRFTDQLRPSDRHPSFYEDLFANGASAIGELHALLGNDEVWKGLAEGDVRAGLGPQELAERSLAITLLEAVMIHPRTPEPLRAEAAEVLAELAARPLPPVSSNEAYGLMALERGTALESLIRFDRGRAVTAYRKITEPAARRMIQRHAKHRLLRRGGMDSRGVRSLFRELEGA